MMKKPYELVVGATVQSQNAKIRPRATSGEVLVDQHTLLRSSHVPAMDEAVGHETALLLQSNYEPLQAVWKAFAWVLMAVCSRRLKSYRVSRCRQALHFVFI